MAPSEELEWQTRKHRIDTKLAALAWKIVPFKAGLDLGQLRAHAVREFPTANGPADYALFVNGVLLGIVEAKKLTVGPQNVLEQAKRYSAGAVHGPGNWDGQRVPFLYSTNGEVIFFLDTRAEKQTSRQISAFHAPSALQSFFATDLKAARQRLMAMPLERIERLRPYQRECIRSVEAAIADGRRTMLIAEATGCGKTFQTIAQIYRLLHSKTAKRILFLVDRKALAAQAVREFNSFTTPDGNKLVNEYEVYSQRFRREDFEEGQKFDSKVLPTEYLTDPKDSHTFVYVSTIQRMTINLFGHERAFGSEGGDGEAEEEAGRLAIPNHAFDLVIADECHRGYSSQEMSTWREVMNYFDAVKIGLTATPAAHTVAVFGEPVFRYGVEQAIRDGYLVDYDAVAIRSEVKMNGVFLKEGESVGKIDTKTGEQIFDTVEDERDFAAEEVERRITAVDSNKKVIQEVAKYAAAHEKETGRFPKILIFAVNDLPHTSHADQLVRICREVFNQGDDFVQKITGSPSVDRPLKLIREFRNRPNPRVVVTVDMLSTGVDIPSLEFIVFLRPVRSRILWEQMLGRGTRRCDDVGKKKFTVFDCFDGTLIKYFRDVSNFKIEAPGKAALALSDVIENIHNNIDKPYYVNVLVKRLRRIEKDMSAEARDDFAKYIPDGDVSRFAAAVPGLIKTKFTATMKLLRDKEFQKLLVQYPRAKRSFWLVEDAGDRVYSTEVQRFGQYDRAEDYLAAFSRFVKENKTKIEAIKILLDRPKDWRPEALDELRKTLKQGSFDEPKLREAHKLVHHKALADIISMVKHAVREEEPILTAQERVTQALQKLQDSRKFNDQQLKWLALIQEHLITNLTLSPDDFDYQPAFQRLGGLARAHQLFQEDFTPLLAQINTLIAAFGAPR